MFPPRSDRSIVSVSCLATSTPLDSAFLWANQTSEQPPSSTKIKCSRPRRICRSIRNWPLASLAGPAVYLLVGGRLTLLPAHDGQQIPSCWLRRGVEVRTAHTHPTRECSFRGRGGAAGGSRGGGRGRHTTQEASGGSGRIITQLPSNQWSRISLHSRPRPALQSSPQSDLPLFHKPRASPSTSAAAKGGRGTCGAEAP